MTPRFKDACYRTEMGDNEDPKAIARSNTDHPLSPVEEQNVQVPGPDSGGHRSKPHRKLATFISSRTVGATVLLSLLRKIRPCRICTD